MEHVQYNAPQGQKTATGREAEFFDVFDEELGGGWPPPLSEVAGPQERVQRHAVQQIEDFVPLVQIRDGPVPQMVDQLVDVLKIFDRGLSEQVIEVPKVTLQDVVPHRAALREPQVAKQLAEVPVPETAVLARGRDALGIEWCQVAGRGGVCWWMARTRHVHPTHPEGLTASPGRYINFWQG